MHIYTHAYTGSTTVKVTMDDVTAFDGPGALGVSNNSPGKSVFFAYYCTHTSDITVLILAIFLWSTSDITVLLGILDITFTLVY
jgi:hypothetical protein